jgi:hypothetical protein
MTILKKAKRFFYIPRFKKGIIRATKYDALQSSNIIINKQTTKSDVQNNTNKKASFKCTKTDLKVTIHYFSHHQFAEALDSQTAFKAFWLV